MDIWRSIKCPPPRFPFHLLVIAILLAIFVEESLGGEQQQRQQKSNNTAAVLARIRQLRRRESASSKPAAVSPAKSLRPTRQTVANGQGTNKERAGGGWRPKAKRYKCYLVDVEEEEGEGDQIGQRSFFAGFQRDRNGGNQIMGWEEMNNNDGARRSEGSRSRYLFSAKRTTEGPTTDRPIIEYVDFDTADEDKSINRQSSPSRIASTTTDAALKGAKFDLSKKSRPQPAKAARRPVKSSETTAEDEDGEDGGGEEESSKELNEEDSYNDLYIKTTTRRPASAKWPRAQGIPSNSAQSGGGRTEPKQVLRSSSKAGGGGAKGKNGGPPKAIPHDVQRSEEEEEEEIHEMRPIAAQHQQSHHHHPPPPPQRQHLPQLLISAAHSAPTLASAAAVAPSPISNTNLWPQQAQLAQQYGGQQYGEQQQQPMVLQNAGGQQQGIGGEPPRDAQGRPLVLSPEHCKMIDNYAVLYGLRTPPNVMSFVHNNCAFAKMYLPAASCAEIDTLVQSCYQQQKRERSSRN